MQETSKLEALMATMSQQLETLLILQRAALIKPDDVFSFLSDDQLVRFYLPHVSHESLQQKILTNSDFYEAALLRKSAKEVEDARVLDIGANIGNHTVFFAKIAGARSVTAFEPQREVFRLLQRNVLLNDLSNVTTHNIALGAQSGTVGLASPPRFRNLGTATFKTGGDYQMESVDSLGIKTDFVKVDVEGFHMDVLRGAADTLAEQRPVIWIELREKLGEFEEANAFLTKLGYNSKPLNPNNFIYSRTRTRV